MNRVSIGSDNGLSPIRRHAIILTNAWILGTIFGEILGKIQNFSFTKMHVKISSAQWRPFCPGAGWGWVGGGWGWGGGGVWVNTMCYPIDHMTSWGLPLWYTMVLKYSTSHPFWEAYCTEIQLSISWQQTYIMVSKCISLFCTNSWSNYSVTSEIICYLNQCYQTVGFAAHRGSVFWNAY